MRTLTLRLLAVAVFAAPALATAQLMPRPRLEEPAAGAELPFAPAKCSERFRWWLPTGTSQEITDCFWQDRAKYLNMVVVAGWTDRGSIYTELYSDAYYGFRLGFSALVASSQTPPSGTAAETNQETAAQRFFAGGGNAVLTVAYPLLYFQAGSEVATYAALLLYPKLGADLPALGGPPKTVPLNLDTALELQGRLDRSNASLGLFASLRAGWVVGNDQFYDGLGVARRSFGFSSGIAGISLGHTLQIAAQFVIYADRELKDKLPPTTINVSLVPSGRS